MLIYKKQGPSSAVSASGCPADPMDIVIRVVGWIELNNPIDVWKVEASLCNIGTQECTALRLTKLKIRRCSLLLFLLSMDVFDWYVDVV